MLDFKKLNNYTGWLLFLISTIVYLITVEDTASFWDCGEFIACAYKLQVPHPPGAPLFLLIGRAFSLLALGDVTQVAYWINISSVLCSSFTILFLFWTITLLGVKMYNTTIAELTQKQTYTLMGAGITGALAYTFSDSFWFSAVESEVYAMSSFFTAIVVWATFKWDLIKDHSLENKWLILIAYITGLSIGVHLLNLVTLPALGLIYYYKKYPKRNIIGVLAALLVSGFIIILIMYGVIPGLPALAGNFEITFVNSFGLPFGSGVIFFVVAFLGSLIFGVFYSEKKKMVLLNTILLCFTFILIGYASYAIILIRSQYNPPINENNPSDIIRFVSYLKREQYGDRPLLYGPIYNSRVIAQDKGDAIYRRNDEKGKYEIYDYKTNNRYDNNMLLPRIYSRSAEHIGLYKEILGINGNKKPNMNDNINFLLKHQLGHMYFRYLMWNFAGRAGDEQEMGWLSPFESKTNVPEEIAKNKARNQFYMLPLILGIIGLIYQLVKNQRMFFVTAMIFFMTGIALILYLNSPPVEPRERDYIYAGSFYAFAMWIGFAVMAIVELLVFADRKVLWENFIGNPDKTKKKTATPVIENTSLIPTIFASVFGISVAILMGVEGWDDHDRSNRYHSVDSAKNLLNSCAPNAILFTGGDNDTFPLWYVQDVEGFRTDVRVCNLSLLGTDWYIDQMKRPVYESNSLPISLVFENYIQGKNDQIPYIPNNPNFSPEEMAQMNEEGMDLERYVQLLKENSKALEVDFTSVVLNTLPSKRMALKLDKKAILAQNIIPERLIPMLQDYMIWDLDSDELYKNDILILDMIATNNQKGWDRPIYFSSTLSTASYLNLKPYLQQEGLVYRLLPVKEYDVLVKDFAPVKLDPKDKSTKPTTKITLSTLGLGNEMVFQVKNKKNQPITNAEKSDGNELNLVLERDTFTIDILAKESVKSLTLIVTPNNVKAKVKYSRDGYLNSDIMFKNMMENFFYRELDNPNVFYSDTYKSFPLSLRNSFYKLCNQLLLEGKKDKAKEAILKCFELMPDESLMYDIYTPPLIDILLQVGETDKALEVADLMANRADATLELLIESNSKDQQRIQSNGYILAQIVGIFEDAQRPEAQKYSEMYNARMGKMK